MSFAVIGAGIIGRLTALRLSRRGYDVTLFDRGDWASRDACSHAAAGLLAPVAEAALGGEAEMLHRGLAAMAEWPEILAALPRAVTLGRAGSLAVVHEPDVGDLLELHGRIKVHLPSAKAELLDGPRIAALEPGLATAGYSTGLLLADEGYVNGQEALAAIAAALDAEPRVRLRLRTEVLALGPRWVETALGRERFDCVADCRGIGARDDLTELRGVRGEIIQVHAPEVELTRPVRVLHQRYPVYIVPRGPRSYVIGATCLESESFAPVTVKAALELLGAAYAAHPGFRFAQITALVANCRPAFADNLPRVLSEPGLVRVNGLYRHGFLLAPQVTHEAVSRMLGEMP